MIKTFLYNEFDFKENQYSLDKEQSLKDIDEFVANGGDLNLPIKYENEFLAAQSFLEKQLGVENVTSLFEKNRLTNPGQWILDTKTKTIKESPLYGSYWYRDNYENYKKTISDGFRKLCQDFVQNPIYTTYESYDKTKTIRNDKIHPLLSIVLKMPYNEMIDIFLTEIPESVTMLNSIYFKDQTFADCIIQKTNDKYIILSSFFKHKVFSFDKLVTDYSPYFKNTIKRSINKNDFDFVKHLQNQSEDNHFLGELDKKNDTYDCFLRSVTSPKMAKILIDSGCQVLTKKEDKKGELFFSYHSFSLENLETIKFIMDYVPLNYMIEYQDVFWKYLENCNNIDHFKQLTTFLVSQGFPIENYDLFNVCPAEDINERIQTCLDLGANPNNCKHLIKKIIRNRDTSLFKTIQKTKLIDLYCDDGLFYLLNADNHTQGTLSLLDKAPAKNLNNINSKGKPIWFAADSKEKFYKVLKHVESLNQLDTDGHNWITYYYSKNLNDQHKIVSTVLEMTAIEQSKNGNLLHLTNQENTSNLLHYGFNIYGKNQDFEEDFVTIIKTFEHSNLKSLFSTTDEHGLFPIEYLIKSYHEPQNYNKSFWASRLDCLLKMAEYDLDYDKTNSKGEKLIDCFRHFFSLDDTKNIYTDNINKLYHMYKLHDKLEHSLTTSEERKQTIPKI